DTLREPVDEEVDQQVEASIAVCVAEMLGDGEEVGELVGGECSDVVSCGVCRLLVQRALDLDAQVCRLVEGEAVDEREQEVVGRDRELVRDAARPEDRE